MKSKKIILTLLCGIMTATSISSIAFAGEKNSNSDNSQIEISSEETINSGVLLNENDTSWLEEYEILDQQSVAISQGDVLSTNLAIMPRVTTPTIPGDEEVIKRITKYKTFNYGMTSVMVGTALQEGISFIPSAAIQGLARLGADALAYKISTMPNVYSVCTYYHLRGADGRTRYALSMSNYRNSNYIGYIDGTYHNVDPYGN